MKTMVVVKERWGFVVDFWGGSFFTSTVLKAGASARGVSDRQIICSEQVETFVLGRTGGEAGVRTAEGRFSAIVRGCLGKKQFYWYRPSTSFPRSVGEALNLESCLSQMLSCGHLSSSTFIPMCGWLSQLSVFTYRPYPLICSQHCANEFTPRL